MKSLLILFGVLLIFQWGHSQPPTSRTCKLTMTVKNIAKKGVLYAGVCNSESSFKKRQPVMALSKSLPIHQTGDQVLEFDLPPGVYAIAVFLDTNGNGTLDFRFGKPTEMVGMTNNPRKIGPPGWKDGAFRIVNSASTTVWLHQK